jgi:hypothetical protein
LRGTGGHCKKRAVGSSKLNLPRELWPSSHVAGATRATEIAWIPPSREEHMQSLLKSLSPVECRIYWRWTLIVLAFYALLLVVGGSIVVFHRTMANASAADGHATGKAAERIKPGMSVPVAR